MLTKALEKHADRVEIVAATTSQAEDKRRALLENKNIEQLFQLVSADSDKELQSSTGSRHPKVVWLTFPLEDGAASKGPVMDRLGRSRATEVIEKLGLYQNISADLADLQRSLFEESWRDFLKDLNSACPITINQTACSDLASRWEAIPVVATGDSTKRSDHKESSAKTQLIYDESQSEDRWAEKFVATALQLVQGSKAHDQLKPVADDISARVFQGYPYGKLSRLRKASLKKNASSISAIPSLSKARCLCRAPRSLQRGYEPVSCGSISASLFRILERTSGFAIEFTHRLVCAQPSRRGSL